MHVSCSAHQWDFLLGIDQDCTEKILLVEVMSDQSRSASQLHHIRSATMIYCVSSCALTAQLNVADVKIAEHTILQLDLTLTSGRD